MKIKTNFLRLLPTLFTVIGGNVFLRAVDCALVRLEKHCFNVGDTITVRFIGVEGEGVFIGMYEKSGVPDITNLPELQSESLKDWVLTCGERDTCDDWPVRGIVQLSTFGLKETEEYIIAVSGDRSGLVPQSTTKTFVVGDCTERTPVSSLPLLSPTRTPTVRPIMLGPTQPINIPNQAPVVDVTIQSGGVVSDAIIPIIQEARNLIMDLIRADGDLVGKVRIDTCIIM